MRNRLKICNSELLCYSERNCHSERSEESIVAQSTELYSCFAEFTLNKVNVLNMTKGIFNPTKSSRSNSKTSND
jgi:hypothetical protein